MKLMKTLPLAMLLVFGAAACSDDSNPFDPSMGDDMAPQESRGQAAFDQGEPSILGLVGSIIEESGEFSILAAVIGAADPSVAQTLDGRGQFTVFAPTNAAFVDLLDALGTTPEELLVPENREFLTNVLLYHVARGRSNSSSVLQKTQLRMLNGEFTRIDGIAGTINDSRIIQTDVSAGNGIVHVIDAVLLPPGQDLQGNRSQPTIFDLVEELGKDDSPEGFSILKAAIMSADPAVAEALAGNAQLTVFAPTNAAFVALLAELGVSAEELLGSTDLLTSVLLYHVTRGRLFAAEVRTKDQLRMLDGNFAMVTNEPGKVLIDDAEIIAVDFETRNGIVHVIDAVLLPS